MDIIEAKPALVWSPHPLTQEGREIVYAHFLTEESIEEYLYRVGILDRMGRQYFVLTVNGAKVPRAMWKHVFPKTGTLINIFATVHGGDQKNPLAIIAMIALMAVAPEIAPLLAGEGASAFTLRLVGAGITILGGIAINKIFPPPRTDLSDANARESSPTFSLTGGQNRARPFEPMIKIVGTHRVVPDLGAQPFTEFEGDNQVLFQVFDLGYNDAILTDFKIGLTPINNFEGVEIEISGADGELKLFPGNVDSIEGGAFDRVGTFIQRTTSPDTVSIGVELVGILFLIDASNHQQDWRAIFQIEIRAVGTTTWIPVTIVSDQVPVVFAADGSLWEGSQPTIRVSQEQIDAQNDTFGVLSAGQIRIINGTRSLFKRLLRINVVKGQYEVRIKFIPVPTPAGFQVTVFDDPMSWSQLRSYQPDDTDYTGRLRVGLKIRASGQINGVVDQFNCIARAKTQVWNGAAFVQAETSNPAWWFLDAARGKTVNGARVWGGNLADAKIDIEGIKAFGAWCEATGQTLNFVFDQQQSVFNVLQMIALNGRGTPSWGTGKLGVIWDAPSLPITAHFGMHNIVAGTFEIHYSTENLADTIEAEFINPDLDWQRDIVRAQVPGFTTNVNPRKIQLAGRTSKQLATEDANLYAAGNFYRARKYVWQSDWEAMPCSRGDVVGLTHDLAALDHSGRFVEGGSAHTLILAKEVPLFTLGAFITIIKPDGTFSSFNVAGGAGSTNTLTATPDLPFNLWADANHPPYDYKWKYGPAALQGKKVKVESFKPMSDKIVEISAIDEVDAYYASKTNPVVNIPPPVIFGDAPILTNLQLTEEGVRAGNGYLVKVVATWDVAGRYSFADVAVAIDGNLRQISGKDIHARTYSFTVNDFSDVSVFVTGYSDLGRFGKSAKIDTSKTINFAGLKSPSVVTGFTLAGKVFEWTEILDVDLAGYEIRFHIDDKRTWEDASPFHKGLLTESPWEAPYLPPGRVTFLVRALDAAGIYSEESSIIIKELGDSLVANVLETFDQKALGWPGTITNGTIDGSNNVVASTSTLLYGPDDLVPFYTNDADAFYASSEFLELTYLTPLIVPTAPLFGSSMTVAFTFLGDPVYLDWSLDGQTPFYTSNDTDLLYSASDLDMFYDPPGEFTPWLGMRIIQAGDRIQFRAMAAQGDVQGQFQELTITIDAPDVTLQVDDVVLAPAGTRIPIPLGKFSVIKNVQSTLQSDGGTAVTITIEDKDPIAGPLITARNSSLVGVAATADFFIQGY